MITERTIAANPAMPMSVSGPQNLRELGGYPSGYNTQTACGRLLRSDELYALNGNDREMLFDYGVRCIIDLRKAEECAARPDNFGAFPGLRHYHFPLRDDVPTPEGARREPDCLSELYVHLLENQQGSFAEILRAIARQKQGCVLFHCAAGKDRTGLVAMLLLMLAGVPDEVIIRDYCSSCHNMAVIFASQKLRMHLAGLAVNEALFRSSRVDIEGAITHLYSQYGDAEGYCKAIGCSDEVIQALRQRLLENAERA